MKIKEVIAAHLAWKERLQHAIDVKVSGGGCIDAFAGHTPASIACDDKCVLGQWIYGEGKKYARTSLFFKVKQLHKEFHLHAGEIAQCVCDQQYDHAEELLKVGKYAETSAKIIGTLESLGNMVELWDGKDAA